LLDSTLQMVRNIPHLALIPLVILWFGIDEAAKLFLVALGVFFPFYVNTLHGVRSIDPQLMEMGRAYGLSERQLFLRVVLPGALPSIFVGLRYGLGIMWLTLIVAETIAASSGIGYMAMNAREFMLVDVVVFAILVYAALGKFADSIARLLERICLSWNPVYAMPAWSATRHSPSASHRECGCGSSQRGAPPRKASPCWCAATRRRMCWMICAASASPPAAVPSVTSWFCWHCAGTAGPMMR
jgi:ABC-type proline/glycine betaine transport system permease subunit